MFDTLTVRNKFLAAAAVPTNVLVIIAIWSVAIAGETILAAIAGVGVVLTVAVGTVVGTTTAKRARAVAERANRAVAGDEAAAERPDECQDEIGDADRAVAAALTRARKAVADQQAVSRNVHAVVKNLADRNHELLERQLDNVDWLEATEEDPDRLEHLFELDHLATRMRRTCESIMVIAGAESLPSRAEAAPISDVVRVAIAENEKYRTIAIRSLDEAMIEGAAACGLAHLLSELLENATRFSPDDEQVELHGTRLDDETYRLTIIDRGCGMDDDHLASANALVSNPPDIDLSPDGSIGLVVVGRLGRQLGATVELSATAGSGVTAEVLVPADAVAAPPETARTDPAAADSQGPRSTLSRLIGDDSEWTPPAVPPPAAAVSGGARAPETGSDQSETLDEALGRGADFDAGVQTLLRDTNRPQETWSPPETVTGPGEIALTRRQRGSGPRAKSRSPITKASSRKPDEVRSMITRYRDGLKDGRPEASDQA